MKTSSINMIGTISIRRRPGHGHGLARSRPAAVTRRLRRCKPRFCRRQQVELNEPRQRIQKDGPADAQQVSEGDVPHLIC